MILDGIPPGLSPAIQLYVRGSDNTVGSAVGSSINGNAGAYAGQYTFNLGEYSSGDYFAVLSGVSTPNAAAFPVRDDVAYPFTPWSIVAATVAAVPPTPNPITSMCNLLVATNQAGSRAWAKLADANNTVDDVLVSQQVVEATTDEDGNATLVLIQGGAFIVGGNYRVRVADTNRNITHNLLVRMPNASSANLEDLTPL